MIAKRPADKDHGGLWEFPGGKIELSERPSDALQRELKEEIGIDITSFHAMEQVAFNYPTKRVVLYFFKVTSFKGEPKGLEDQEVRWIRKTDLTQFSFPEANQPIVEALATSKPN